LNKDLFSFLGCLEKLKEAMVVMLSMHFSQPNGKRLQLTLSAVPAVVLTILVGITIVLHLSGSFIFNPPYVLLTLNVIFLSGTGIVVAFISASSYLNHGSLNILLLGSAVLIGALVATIAGVAAYDSPNYNNAIYNTGILVSSIFQFLSALATVVDAELKGTFSRKTLLKIAYLITLFFVGVLTVVVFAGFAPVFLTQTGQPTPIRQLTLGLSVAFFASSFVLFGWQYFKTKSKILFLYSIALGLFAVGLVSAFAVHHSGELLTWLARLTLYVGSFYFVAAVLASRTETDDALGLSDKWAEAFRSNREQVADFFTRLSEGFAYCKMANDKAGKSDFVYLDVNDAFEKMMGKTRNDIVGKKNSEVVIGVGLDPESRQVLKLYEDVAFGGANKRFERYSKFVDKWFSILVYSPSKGYFATLLEDITERKKLEEQTQRLLGTIQQEKDRLSSLLNSMTDEVWFADTKKKITLANPSATKEFKLDSLGTEKVENIAASFEVYRADGTPRPVEEAPPLRALKGEVLTNQVEIVKTPATGELRYRQVNAAPVRDNQGKIIGSVSVVRDITELKQIQNRLEKYSHNLEKLVEERTKQLKESERLAAIGATAGMVGHDIRNPLQAITGDVYLAKNELTDFPDSDAKRNILESLDETEKNIDYINKIVQDLQDYARPLNPNPTEVDLKLIIDKMIEKNGLPPNVKVNLKVEPDARKIVADSDYLTRILYNLFINAIQAMPNGGKLTIRSVKDKATKETILTVEDTGVGIPEKAKVKMFTPMFTTKSKGQGFGLAVVKRMTESLGGTVSFESEEGKGTTFTLRLPPQGSKRQMGI
jgi:PAS domain S-box-containing protein